MSGARGETAAHGRGPMLASGLARSLTSAALPVCAVLFAVACASSILVLSGASPLAAMRAMIENASSPVSAGIIVNGTATYYLAAAAAAIGFRVNLFNIGAEGQYKLAALAAATVGAWLSLPPPFGQVVVIAVSIAVGAVWSGVAAAMKIWRGVSEVISTIALNFVALGLISTLLLPTWLGVTSGSNTSTAQISEGTMARGWELTDSGALLWGLTPLAVIVGIGYYVLFERTTLGFELRATGMAPQAARFAGASPARTVLIAMLLSGGVAGLIGIPTLLGQTGSYGLSFPSGLGFTGIAVALLGGNRATGMALAAVLFSFLDNSSNVLQLNGVSAEIVKILEGITVLCLLIAYQLSGRLKNRERRGSRPSNPLPTEGSSP